MPQTVHVYPNNDLIEHDTDGSDCPCGPTPEAEEIPPTCDADRQAINQPEPVFEDEPASEEKSRYCKRKWYC